MFNGICIIDTVFNPESLFGALTFWTVTIAAAIVAYMLFPTVITTILMSAQSRGPAHGQGSKNAELIRVWMMVPYKTFAKPPDNLCNFVFGAAHKAFL